MEELSLQGSVKKMRILTIALIISGAMNIGLIVKEIVPHPSQETSPTIRPLTEGKTHFEVALDRYFAQMEKLSFHELVSYLTNKDLVDEGYLKRDLALSALVAFHHFHLEKALSGFPLQRREVPFEEGKKIALFPGLSQEHFDAIIRFAYEEKWPLTAEGIFKLLKKWKEPKDESLAQAFHVTPEFHALQVLLQKTESNQTDEALLQLVHEGSWDVLHQFAEQQANVLDLSVERRRSLLLNYVSLQSKTAAYMLLKTDFAFVVKRFADAGLATLLPLLDEKTEEAERLCTELLKSPRSDAIWGLSASMLYRYAGEEVPSPLDISLAMQRFSPSKTTSVVVKEEPPRIVAPAAKKESPATKKREHVVKEGESLWKIARQYNVKVDEIVKMNEMEKDRLYPGMVLRIP